MINVPCNITGNGYVASYNLERGENNSIIKININLSQKYLDVIGANTTNIEEPKQEEQKNE